MKHYKVWKCVGITSVACAFGAMLLITGKSVINVNSSPVSAGVKTSEEIVSCKVNNEISDSRTVETAADYNSSNDSLVLELHRNDSPVYSMEEVDELITDGIEKCSSSNRPVVSTREYASKLAAEKYNSNSADLKTYIYHMMLNSIDYFNSAEGSMIYALNTPDPINIKFQTDMSEKISYESESQFDSTVNEFFVSDGKIYCVDSKKNKYTETPCACPIDFIVSDNERVITLDDGETMKLNRNDLTNLGTSGNSCLFPQSYATAYLSDFENWKLGKTVKLLERDCIEIEGVSSGNSFKMTVDILTGSLLKYETYDKSGKVSGYIEVLDIEFDKPISVKTFDKALYVRDVE